MSSQAAPNWAHSSAGRAPALQAGGHRFEPYWSHYGWIPEWPKGADCKSVGNAFEGSNPSPSIKERAGKSFEIPSQSGEMNNAGWSSLEARRAHNPKVVGSNPAPATFAQIAQLVEQWTENPCVAGSIPALGMCFVQKHKNGILAQSVEHLTFNQVVRGSNPRCFI